MYTDGLDSNQDIMKGRKGFVALRVQKRHACQNNRLRIILDRSLGRGGSCSRILKTRTSIHEFNGLPSGDELNRG
jgi:hypothetical protein